MTDLHVTKHAKCRMQQRGIAPFDIDLAMRIGTEVSDGLLIRQRDFQAYERTIKRELERARRLVGKRLVISGKHLVTAYHASKATQRRVLHQSEERALV